MYILPSFSLPVKNLKTGPQVFHFSKHGKTSSNYLKDSFSVKITLNCENREGKRATRVYNSISWQSWLPLIIGHPPSSLDPRSNVAWRRRCICPRKSYSAVKNAPTIGRIYTQQRMMGKISFKIFVYTSGILPYQCIITSYWDPTVTIQWFHTDFYGSAGYPTIPILKLSAFPNCSWTLLASMVGGHGHSD